MAYGGDRARYGTVEAWQGCFSAAGRSDDRGLANMSVGLRDLVVLVFAAGAITAVVRAMTRDTGDAKGRRGRLRELAWCTALLVLSAMVASTGYLLFGRSSAWWIVVPIVALIIIV